MENLYFTQKITQSGDQSLLTMHAIDAYTMIKNMQKQKFDNYKHAPTYKELQQELLDEMLMEEEMHAENENSEQDEKTNN